MDKSKLSGSLLKTNPPPKDSKINCGNGCTTLEYIKNHQIVCFKVSEVYIACDLHFNKGVIRIQTIC